MRVVRHRLLRLLLTVFVCLLPLAHAQYGAPAPAGAGQAYSDPQGRFRMVVPAGWQVKMQGDVPSFVKGASSVQVILSSAASPQAGAEEVAANYHQGFKVYNLLNHGNATVANHAAHGINIDGTANNGQRLSVLILAQSAGANRCFVLLSSTPAAEAAAVNGEVMALANSVRFAGE